VRGFLTNMTTVTFRGPIERSNTVAKIKTGTRRRGAPPEFGEGCGAFLRWMLREWRRPLPKPPRVGRRGPPGPDRARAAGPVPSLYGPERSVESTERRGPLGPRRAHCGAHRGPFWGPFGVGRIIPLQIQGIGRKSARRAQGAHWGPGGAHWGPRPLPLSLGPTGPSMHAGQNREGHPRRRKNSPPALDRGGAPRYGPAAFLSQPCAAEPFSSPAQTWGWTADRAECRVGYRAVRWG
jgi:hypothetical protein